MGGILFRPIFSGFTGIIPPDLSGKPLKNLVLFVGVLEIVFGPRLSGLIVGVVLDYFGSHHLFVEGLDKLLLVFSIVLPMWPAGR